MRNGETDVRSSEQKAKNKKEKEVAEVYGGGGSGYHRSDKKQRSGCRAVRRNVWNPQLGSQRGRKEGKWLYFLLVHVRVRMDGGLSHHWKLVLDG